MKPSAAKIGPVLAALTLGSLAGPVRAQQTPQDLVPFKATAAWRIDGFPIPLDPPVISARMTGTGQSDLLGAFTTVGHAMISLGVDGVPLFPMEEVQVFTAANGDALFVSIGGFPRPSATPGIFVPEGNWKIIGGRGRFAGAVGSGAFKGQADFAKNEATLTLEGKVSRPKP
jgi:hypothetical protein